MLDEKIRPKDLVMQNARILPGSYKNFSGVGTKYNQEGSRNFNLLLDNETAAALEEEGWNVKWTKESPDRPSEPFLKVNIKYYDNFAPDIDVVKLDTGRITHITEKTINELDNMNIEYVDVVIRPKWYEMSETNKGWSARLQELNAYVQGSPIKRNLDAYRTDDFDEE